MAAFTENSKPYPLTNYNQHFTLTNAWEKFRWIFIGHLRQFIYLFIFTLFTVDLKLLIYTKKPLYSLYSNNIELIDVNFVTEQDMQSFPKEFLKSMRTNWQTHTHTHWSKKHSKENSIPVLWVFWYSLYKSYMLQIYFTKPTGTLQRHPFLIFLLKILKDCDNLILLGTRSHIFGPRNKMNYVPFAFVMCHFGENCMDMWRAQIYHLK